jgi:hypothetical protein
MTLHEKCHSAEQGLHELAERPVTLANHDMQMIRHDGVSKDLHIVRSKILTHVPHNRSLEIILEERFAVVKSRRQVKRRAGQVWSQSSSHGV